MPKIITKSREETENFAYQYAKSLRAGDVVLLDGDMGAGKTVFAKGVAKGLNIQEEVTSPTYAYMNDYDGRLFHYDCYRIESPAQAESLGLADYFDMGGMEMQINVISADTLKEAQKNPDDYKDLVVRVAGFSAYFVELHITGQNDLISRTELNM